MRAANAARGEAGLEVGGQTLLLRPTFAALVAAEAELGPLFALVERAAAGELKLAEMAALFWHCLDGAPAGLTRETFSRAAGRRRAGRRDAGAARAAGPGAGRAMRFEAGGAAGGAGGGGDAGLAPGRCLGRDAG